MKNKEKIFLVIYFIIIVIIVFSTSNPKMLSTALDYVGCGTVNGIPKPVPQLINIAYILLTIGAPIVLIIFSIVTLVKAIMSRDEESIMKAKMKLIKKFIIAGIIFFMAAIVQFVISQVTSNENDKSTVGECLKCFLYYNGCVSSTSGNNVNNESKLSTYSNRAQKTGSNRSKRISDGLSNKNSSNNSGSTTTNSNLKSKINSYLSQSGASGTWTVYVKNLKNNSVVDINASRQMVSASTIKLFIMEYLYDLVRLGKAKESDFESNVRPMIQNSDNDATNRLIDKYGMSNINKYITGKYNQSKLQRKMLTAGNENYTSAKDIGTLLENMYNGKLVNATYSKKMLSYLKNQTLKSKIPAGVPSGTVTANKTGELSTVENDAAIIYSKGGDYIIVVLSNGLSDTAKARSNITQISKMVYESFNK